MNEQLGLLKRRRDALSSEPFMVIFRVAIDVFRDWYPSTGSRAAGCSTVETCTGPDRRAETATAATSN